MEQKGYAPVSLGARYQIRVEDLGDADFLHVRCEGCGHIAMQSAARLRSNVPRYQRLVDLAAAHSRSIYLGNTATSWSVMRRG